MLEAVQSSLYALLLVLSAGILLALSRLIWRRRREPTESTLLLGIGVTAIWLVSYAVELHARTPEAALFWFRVRSIGLIAMPTLWLLFVLTYTHHAAWFKPGRLALFSLPPVVMYILIWTNDQHRLVYRILEVIQQPHGPEVREQAFGPVFWVYFGYVGLQGLLAIAVLVRHYQDQPHLYRDRLVLLIIAWLFPTTTLVVRTLGLVQGLNMTPFVVALFMILLIWLMYVQRQYELTPARYEQIITSMMDGVVVLDMENRIVSINPAAMALVASLSIESLGLPVTRVFRDVPDLLGPYPADARIEKQIALHLEDGLRHFDLRIFPLVGEEGQTSGRVILLRDVTESLEASAQLRKLSRAVEQSGSIIFITDPRGTIEYVNPKFTEVTGYTADEALYQTPRILRSGEASDQVYANLWQTLNAGQDWKGEFHNRKKNGQLYWAQATISPVFDLDGALTHYVAIQEDITEQKAIAEEEHRQRLLAEALRDNAEAINSTRDLHEVLSYVLQNAGRAVFAPYEQANIMLIEDGIGRVVHQYRSEHYPLAEEHGMPPELPVSTTPTLRYVCETGQPLLIEDTRTFAGWVDIGSSTWIRAIVCVPIRVEDEVIGALHVNSSTPGAFQPDTVERLKAFTNQAAVAIHNAQSFETIQRYAAELETRNRELDSFSHTVAHDLRAPLALVIGYLGLVMEEEISPEALSYLNTAFTAADRMNAIIDSLLLLAQIRNADEVLKPVALEPVITSALERFTHDIDARGIQVALETSAPQVLGYAPWIEEAVANLVSNAIKYIGQQNPNPLIAVRTCVHDGVVRCEVRDNGMGIAPENQEKLFEMFSRFHRNEAQGFGLGLSIVMRIITRLGGQLGVESAPGEGSTFWFTLPQAE